MWPGTGDEPASGGVQVLDVDAADNDEHAAQPPEPSSADRVAVVADNPRQCSAGQASTAKTDHNAHRAQGSVKRQATDKIRQKTMQSFLKPK